jgi:hypothetical protein
MLIYEEIGSNITLQFLSCVRISRLSINLVAREVTYHHAPPK